MTPLRASGLPPRSPPKSPHEHDKWFISVSLAVDPRRWCSCHGGTDTRPAVLRKPLLRHPRAGINTWVRYVWALPIEGGESARWLPAVAGRAPMRRFVQQPLPFSTSTRFVNSLVIKFSEYTPIYARVPCPWNIVQTRVGSDVFGSWFIETYTRIRSENWLTVPGSNFIAWKIILF